MSRIADAFAKGKKAFITYLVAGDPNLETCAEYIQLAADAGADLIEIGIPFSDPIAEGPTIQAASVRALAAGARLDAIFDMVAGLKGKVSVPLVFMTYLNPVFVYGYERFFKKCVDIGVSGVIIPDLPFEYAGEAQVYADAEGIEIITLIAPTSEARVKKIARSAKGFIYLVSSMGVTGVRSEITSDIRARTEAIKELTDVPVAVGFGISKPEQVREFTSYADGVIVGSALVNIIAEQGEHAHDALRAYISEMKAATRQE